MLAVYPLFDLTSFKVTAELPDGLPRGKNIFYFGVDTNPNFELDSPPYLYFDFVEVNVR